MSFYEDFFKKYPQAIDSRGVPQEIMSNYETILPGPIIDIWKKHGWGGYRDGLFWTINPDKYLDYIKKWVVMDYEEVYPIMRTAFGDLIIIYNFKEADEEYEKIRTAVIDIKHHDADKITIGLEDFFETCLLRIGRLINSSKIDSDLFDDLVNKYGVLNYDLCYGFDPILPLYRKENIKNVKIVDFDTHLETLTQALAAPLEGL